MDSIFGFASTISKDLVHGVVDELRYSCCFNNLVEDLQNEEEKLVETRNCVQERVDHANRQTRKTAGFIHKWLKQAHTLTNNVDELLKKARTKNSCCFGHCPNWIWRYHLGKQLAKNKRDIKKCIEEGSKYTQFERLVSLPGLEYFSSERCLRFESRESAYEQLMKALKGDEVNMIGLYGMGGCGKTTLAIEVGRKAKEEGLFHEVVFVAVPATVEVQRIQEKIASWLDYDLDEKEDMRRAQRLFKRLTQEEKALVIMDDVWERLDFEAIGIPSCRNHKGCKVLITTRSEEVCIRNDCQEKIQLSTLTHEEAWSLFQIQAHISEGTPNTLKNLARQISDECEGLLVAITAVASTLKGKAEDDWNVALDRLKSSKPVNIGKGLQNPYNCLRLSYDNLDTEEQSLFLLCSVFPEDFEIPVENLIRFAIGLGLVGEIRSFEGARHEVSAAKNKLISSCLLSGAAGGKLVKMHDLVRGVALWIASNENKVVKCVLEKDVIVEYASIRYLWCKEFPNELDCSHIELLCIKTDLEVSYGIFKGMERLRVLFLCWEGLWRRPLSTMSFKSLTNLRCLFLSGWVLVAMSFVGDMKKLESLTLHNCSFLESIDAVVTQLTNLRLLDLSECEMERNPFEVIGRHPQLEELYIDDCRSEWDLYNESTAEFFSKFSVPQALKRYQIRLGTVFSCYQEKLLSRGKTLFLSCFDTFNAAVKNLAKKTEVLYIANIHGGAKNVIPDIFQIEGGGIMNYAWTELLICDSEAIELLVDTGNHLSEVGTLLSELRKLTIERMKHLGCLYHGRDQSGLFEKLEELYIAECPQLHGTLFDWKLNVYSLKALELYACPKLTSVFTPAAAQSVVHLEKLEILYCDGLKHVLADDDGREEEEISNDDHMLVFQKLKQLTVRGCKKIEYIVPVTLAQALLQLECLEIEVDPELKYVFGSCKYGANQSQNELKVELPLLEKLTLVNLPNIISVCPINCYATWPSLCQFALRNCPEFSIVSDNTSMAGSEGRQCDQSTTKMTSNGSDIIEIRVMKDLELAGIFQVAERSTDGEEDPFTKCLQKLSYVCNALIQSMNLQNLEQMEVSGSREFITGGLPQLKEFMTGDCNQADQIFIDEDGERHHFLNLHLESNDQLEDFPESSSIPSAPSVNYNSGPFNPCNLRRMILRSCSMLRTLFSPSTAIHLTSLEELKIAECHGLRYIVTCESAHENKGEIIPKDQDSQSYASMFPRLKRISVMNCNLLEHVLHVSFALGLVELKDIEIRKAPQLRYIFGENIHDHVYASNQHQDKIHIELPVLEKIALFSIPNMINICPDNYYATCSSLQQIVMDDVGLSTLSVNNLMVRSGSTHSETQKREESTHSGHSRGSTWGRLSQLDIGAASKTNGQVLGSVSIWNSSKIRGIFHVDGFHVNGPPVTSWLMYLNLVNLPELRYIWKGAKHFVTLQNLSLLYIWGCHKLKAIFSPCVLRSLPKLKILVVLQCDELEQIIEEDENNEIVSDPQSTKVCFSKLKLLLVTHCNKLKRMFYLSTSHEFPELEYLIINQNPLLEEVFGECEQVAREGRVEALLPELKHVILMQLPNLNNISQGIEFNGLANLFVHNCPKLSLAATTTVEGMLRSYCHDREIDFFVRCDLLYIRDIITKENAEKDLMLKTTSRLQMNPQHQEASSSEVLSSRVIGSSQPLLHNLAGSVHELDQTRSGATESHKILTSDRKNKRSQELQSLEQKLSPNPSANLTQGEFVHTPWQESKNINEEEASHNQYYERRDGKNPDEKEIPYGEEHEEPEREELNKEAFHEPECSYGQENGRAELNEEVSHEKARCWSVGITQGEEHLDLGFQDHTPSEALHDPSIITEELNSLVECGELPAECVAALCSFLTTQPSMRLAVVDNSSVIVKGIAYSSLYRLVTFLATQPLSSLLRDKRSEFFELVRLVGYFPFNKGWLRDLEGRVTTSFASSSSGLEQLRADKQQFLSKLESLQARFNTVRTELDDLEAREANIQATLDAPFLQL